MVIKETVMVFHNHFYCITLYYLHSISVPYHVSYFMEKYGGIHKFSCNPIEAKNHRHTQVICRGTMKGGCGSMLSNEVSNHFCFTIIFIALRYFICTVLVYHTMIHISTSSNEVSAVVLHNHFYCFTIIFITLRYFICTVLVYHTIFHISWRSTAASTNSRVIHWNEESPPHPGVLSRNYERRMWFNVVKWGECSGTAQSFLLFNNHFYCITLFYLHSTSVPYHVPYFMEKYGGIHKFSCNPIEAKNHRYTQVFFQGTMKGGCDSTSSNEVSAVVLHNHFYYFTIIFIALLYFICTVLVYHICSIIHGEVRRHS